jgi:hypothetical protein
VTEKLLGKISDVRFGFIPDYPFLFGLDLTFKLSDSSGIGTGGKYTVNISEACKWSEEEKNAALIDMINQVIKIMKDAKITNISDLKNKPVEVTIDRNIFKDFRILTEVL